MNWKKITIPATLMLVGAIVLFLPDSNQRIFSLSDAHGPSLTDALGLVILFAGYIWLIALLSKPVRKTRNLLDPSKVVWIVFTIGQGTGLIIASVVNDYGLRWVWGALC